MDRWHPFNLTFDLPGVARLALPEVSIVLTFNFDDARELKAFVATGYGYIGRPHDPSFTPPVRSQSFDDGAVVVDHLHRDGSLFGVEISRALQLPNDTPCFALGNPTVREHVVAIALAQVINAFWWHYQPLVEKHSAGLLDVVMNSRGPAEDANRVRELFSGTKEVVAYEAMPIPQISFYRAQSA